MKSRSAISATDLSSSVLVVPPLARQPDLALNLEENERLIRHIESGSVSTLLYGGKANFYNLPLSSYAETLAFLAETVAADTWLIPSAGPDHGRLMDQAAVLRDFSFPTVMVLPQRSAVTPAGVEKGLRYFAERLQRPIILYLKFEEYLAVDRVQRLVEDGLVAAIKYAIVRPEPRQDGYLRRLLDYVDRRIVVSGIGELPAVVHLRDFGLNSFTSGSGAIAPRASMALLRALIDGDYSRAEELQSAFLPLEDCRDAIGPIEALHDAVRLAGICDTGPILPLLHNLENGQQAAVRERLAPFWPSTVAWAEGDTRPGSRRIVRCIYRSKRGCARSHWSVPSSEQLDGVMRVSS